MQKKTQILFAVWVLCSVLTYVYIGTDTPLSKTEETYEPLVDEPTIRVNESTPYLFSATVRGYVFDDGGENCSITLQYGDKGHTNTTKEIYKCRDVEESMEWSGDPIVLPSEDPDINNTVDERIDTYAALYTSSSGPAQRTYINETMQVEYPNATPYWTFRYATKEWHDNQNGRHSYGDVYVRIYNWSADSWDMLWEETGSQEHTNAIKTDRSLPIQPTHINGTNKIKISTELYIVPNSYGFGQQGAWYYEGKIEYKENSFMTGDETEIIIEDLQRSTPYYYKFSITNSNSTTESGEESFTTLPTEPAGITGNSTSYYDLATIRGKITEDGGENCTVWFEYGIHPHLGNTTTTMPGLFMNDTFNQTIYALQPDQEYTYRAAIHNINGTYYGDNKTFTTLDFLHVNETNTPYYMSLEHLELWEEMHFEDLIIDENCTLSVTENSNVPLILNCSNSIYINGTINVSGHNGEGKYSGAGGGAIKILASRIIVNGHIYADGGDTDQLSGDSDGIAGGYDGVPEDNYGLGPGGGKYGTDGSGGGGGYGTAGQRGQNYWPSEKSWGGITYGYADLRQWGNNSQNVTNPYSGVEYSQLVGGSSGAGEWRYPGAGSGGTIWLDAPEILLNGSLSAQGGTAEYDASYMHGGKGGDGRIRIDCIGEKSEINVSIINPVPHIGLNISTMTKDPQGIEETNATLWGNISTEDTGVCTAWFAWGAQESYGNETTYVLQETGTSHNAEVLELSPGKIYHYRAEAQHSDEKVMGEDKRFITKPYHPTTLAATKDIAHINLSWEKGEGTDYTYIERNNNSEIWSRGEGVFVANTTKTYWHDANATMAGTYHYQAWSQAEETDDTTLYAWSTLNDSVTVQVAQAQTDPPTNITNNSVQIHGTVGGGGTELYASWFEWGKEGICINQTATTNISGNTSHQETLTGLDQGTIYSYRFCINESNQTIYGDVQHVLLPLPAPEGIQATVQRTQFDRISLSWQVPYTNENTTTYIERNTKEQWNRMDGNIVYNGSNTAYIDTTTDDEFTQYYYRAWTCIHDEIDGQELAAYSPKNISANRSIGLLVNDTNTPRRVYVENEKNYSTIVIENDTICILDNGNQTNIMHIYAGNNATINGTLTAARGSGPIEVEINGTLLLLENGSIDISGEEIYGKGGGYYGGDPSGNNGDTGKGPGGGEGIYGSGGGAGGAGYNSTGTGGPSFEGQPYGFADLRHWDNESYAATNPYDSVPYTQCVGGSGGGSSLKFEGGAGGGAIQIEATTMTIAGTIYANGGNGKEVDESYSSWVESAGGSGGTIWLRSPAMNISGSITALGGSGDHGGGAGSEGRIRVDYIPDLSSILETTPPQYEGYLDLAGVADTYPTDGEQNISLNPELAATIIDDEENLNTVRFETNSTGTWQTIREYTGTLGNGEFTANTSQFTTENTTYWWRVFVNDTANNSYYYYFNFTTGILDILYPTPKNNTGYAPFNPTLSAHVYDDIDANITSIVFETNLSGSWVEIENYTGENMPSDRYIATTDFLDTKNTTCHWRVNVTDSYENFYTKSFVITVAPDAIIMENTTIQYNTTVWPDGNTTGGMNYFNSLYVTENHALTLSNNNRSKFIQIDVHEDAIIQGTVTATSGSGPIEFVVGNNMTIGENGSIDISATRNEACAGGYDGGWNEQPGEGPGGGEEGWGAGGAGYATAGDGGDGASSGSAYGFADLSHWNNPSHTATNPYTGMTYDQCIGGSGGGSGEEYYSYWGPGGGGGGAIKLSAHTIYITGSVLANGGMGSDESGGGGSGGTIWIDADLLTITGTVHAIGGDGDPNQGQTGGDGSHGRIRIDYGIYDGDGSVYPSPYTIQYMPVITMLSPEDGSTEIITNPTFLACVADPQGDLAKVQINEKVNGVYEERATYTGSPLVNNSFTASAEQVVHGNTTHQWSVYVEDLAGHNFTYHYSFTTAVIAPAVETNTTANTQETTATLTGNITEDGGDNCTVWFEYGATVVDEYTSATYAPVRENGTYFIDIDSLQPATEYMYRAVIQNSDSTTYGTTKTWWTAHPPNQPTNRIPADNSEQNDVIYVTLSARVTDDEGEDMDISFHWANHSLIGFATSVANNTTTTINLSAVLSISYLQHDTTYSWYMNISDDQTTTTSSTYSFTTREAGDFDGDGKTTYYEVSLFVLHYDESCDPGMQPWDLNDNGHIGPIDASLLVTAYKER